MAQLIQREKEEAEKREVRREDSHTRIDGRERVSGRARYGADWKVPDMLYGRVLMSTIPHGIVKKIDTTKAASIPGVKAIITCLEDKTIWQGGDREHPRRALADRVRFIGETIAAVAATSRNISQEAIMAIEVEYEEMPAVFTIEEARKEGAPKIWEDGNISRPMTNAFGDIEACFKKADLVIEGDYTTQRLSRSQLEPPVSLAWWEGDKLTVVMSTQTVHTARVLVAKDLGIPVDKVRGITLFKGGGFGGGGSSNYDIIAALLAKKAGRPVMVEYSREQDFLAAQGRWASKQHLRAAVSTADTKLLAIDLKAYCDIGAYVRFRPELSYVDGPDTYYSWEGWNAEVYGVHTNTVGAGYMRAPAGPHSCFAVESMVDEIASRLNVNPLELRLRNVVAEKAHLHEHITSNGLEECLLSGSRAFGWKERWRPPPSSPATAHASVSAAPKAEIRKLGKKLTGVGMAVATWHASLGPGEARVRIGRDGIVDVFAGVVDIGTGAKTTMAMIAAGVLGVPVENIRLTYGDTSVSPFARGEVGSMTTTFTGTAVREAATRAKQKIIELASAKLGTAGRDLMLDMRDKVVTTRDGRKLKVDELLASSGLEYVEEKAATEPKLPEHDERLSFAAHFAEVEVDAETGQVLVTRYVAAQDSGEIVNRLTAVSQVRGSVIMGIGMALSEKLMIDTNLGSVQNPSFLNYRLPNHTAIPNIQVIFADVKDPYGPKALGETSIVPVPAAIGNAIYNATGRRLRKLPFAPENVLRAIDSSTTS